MTITAIIHARVSTEEQAAEQLPIKSQIDAGHDLAIKLQAKVREVFIEEGVSGRSTHREKFLQAIAYCEKHKVDYFITWDAFRFSRQSRGSSSASVFKERLARVGTRIVYSSSGLTVDLHTPEGFLREGMDELLGNYYSIKVAQDTMRSMKNNASNGYFNGGRSPYGYRVVPDSNNPKRRRLTLDESEGLVVQTMFKKRLEGMGSKNLARWLNTQGYSNRDRPWNKMSVANVLRSESVIGRTVFNRYDKSHGKRLRDESEWIRVDSHEPIIDIATWHIVQGMMDEGINPSSGHPKSQHLFTGLCRCAKCDSVMLAKSSRGGKYYYYECRNKDRYGSCDQKGVRLDKLEQELVDVICARVFSYDALKLMIDELNSFYSELNDQNGQKWKGIERKLQIITKEINNLLDVLQVVGTTTESSYEIVERLKNKTTEKNRLENEIKELKNNTLKFPPLQEADIVPLSQYLTKAIKETTEPVRIRQFFMSFIEKVQVSEVQIEIIYIPENLIKSTDQQKVLSKVGRKQNWLRELSLLGKKSIIVPLRS